MVDDYVNKILEHTQLLEQKAQEIKKKQNEYAHKRIVLRHAYEEQLFILREELERLDQDVLVLVKKIKHLLSALRRVAMQEQLNTVSKKTDMLAIDKWITKNELKKIVLTTSSFSYEEQVRQ